MNNDFNFIIFWIFLNRSTDAAPISFHLSNNTSVTYSTSKITLLKCYLNSTCKYQNINIGDESKHEKMVSKKIYINMGSSL